MWFAFLGESKSRPTYRRLCADRDRGYDRQLRQLCGDLIAEGDYPGINPESVARGMAAMSEGLWLDMLVSPRHMTRRQALGIAMDHLAHTFPDHFGDPAQERART